KQPEVTIALTNHKTNNGVNLGTRGYRFAFTNDERQELVKVQICPEDIRRVPELAKRMPLKERVLAELKHGYRTKDELIDLLGLSKREAEQLSPRLTELKRRGTIIDVEGKWGIVHHG